MPIDFFADSLSSLSRVLVGVFLGSIFGVFLGIFRFYLPARLQKNFFIKILFDSPKYPPPIAWIPVVIILFGIGHLASVVVVAIGATPPIFTQVYDGFCRMNSRLRMVADNMEIFGIQRFRMILWPSVMPEFFTGLRVAMGMGWMSIIASEMVAGQSGLGYSIQLHRLNLDYGFMLIDLALIGFVGFLLQEVVAKVEMRFLKWKRIS